MCKYFFLFLLLCSCRSAKIPKSGVVVWESFFEGYKLKEFSQNFFSDSSVIIEGKQLFFFGSFGERPDTAVYETIKYSYFDLRTRHCQDYYELSDKAKPYCNYYVADTMTVGHFFCNDYKLAKRGIWSDPVLISDTTIEGKNYKRARSFFLLNTTNGDYADYYIDCSLNTGIFHLLNSVDDLCKGCTAVRADNISKPIIHTTRFWFDRTKLSKKEKLIFKQWEINAKNVNLPLLTYMDGITTCPHLSDGKDSSRLKKYMPELFKK